MTVMRIKAKFSKPKKLFFALGLGFLFFLSGGTQKQILVAAPDNFALARKAVVHIKSTLFRYSYKDPWKQPYIGGSSGTGFIIEGQAHSHQCPCSKRR